MKKLLTAATLVGLILLVQGTAQAIPILQLYIEGAIYDDITESWVWDPSLTEGPPRLWAIGNTSGPGGQGTIFNVKLSAAYASDEGDLTISLVGTHANADELFDLSIPPDVLATDPDMDPTEPILINTSNVAWGDEPGEEDPVVTDGSSPVLNGGGLVPWHGTFGEGVYWQEFSLGNFTLSDSPLTNFDSTLSTYPTELWFEDAAQINAYTVYMSDWSGGIVQFDLYNHLDSETRGKFAPFSHNASVQPEPASFVIWFLIGLSWVGSAWTHQYRRRWRKWQQEESAAAGTRGDDQSARLPADQTETQVGGQSAGSTVAG